MSIFDTFERKHDYLVCVDSDGCVMDTMNCKHFHCFGPCMVTEWGLEEWKDEILDRWNVINLFSMTRGINRFKGLAMALGEINEKYTKLLKENNSLTLEDCILLDAVQKGHRISENNVVSLLEKGLLEGNLTDYCISIDVAKKTRQLPEYTRNKGLDKAKIQQMVIQYLQNAGSIGAKRDAIFEYLKEVLPQNKTHEQQERMIGNLLSEMKENGLIYLEGRLWFLKS